MPFRGIGNSTFKSDASAGDIESYNGFPFTVTIVSVHNGINEPTVLSVGFKTKGARDNFWNEVKETSASGTPVEITPKAPVEKTFNPDRA